MMLYNLIGNQPTKILIERMCKDRHVPSTLLFAGPDGVGKGLFALNLVASLMGGDHARKIAQGSHPDVHIYHPEGKNGLHSISSMRQLIEEMQFPPFEAPCKAFIVHDADRMLPTASNALLKTFEEPASDSTIILLSHEPEALLPTIVSRCRKIPFFPIEEEEMVRFIEEKWSKPPEEAKRIAFLAQGSLSKAEFLILQKSDVKTELLHRLLSHSLNHSVFLKTLEELEEHLNFSQEEEGESASQRLKQMDALFEEIFYWYRDLHLKAHQADPRYLFHHTPMTNPRALPSLEKVFTLLAQCRLAVQRSIKLRVALEHFFLQLS